MAKFFLKKFRDFQLPQTAIWLLNEAHGIQSTFMTKDIFWNLESLLDLLSAWTASIYYMIESIDQAADFLLVLYTRPKYLRVCNDDTKSALSVQVDSEYFNHFSDKDFAHADDQSICTVMRELRTP